MTGSVPGLALQRNGRAASVQADFEVARSTGQAGRVDHQLAAGHIQAEQEPARSTVVAYQRGPLFGPAQGQLASRAGEAGWRGALAARVSLISCGALAARS